MRAIFGGPCRVAIAAICVMMGNRDEYAVYNLQAVADQIGVSLSYLEQIFSTLKRSGLVVSVRGPGGGYRVDRPHESITISDVVRALDKKKQSNEFQAIVLCQLDGVKLKSLVNHIDEILI